MPRHVPGLRTDHPGLAGAAAGQLSYHVLFCRDTLAHRLNGWRGLIRLADPAWYQAHRRTAATTAKDQPVPRRPPRKQTVDRDPQAAARATWAHSPGRSGRVSSSSTSGRQPRPKTNPSRRRPSRNLTVDRDPQPVPPDDESGQRGQYRYANHHRIKYH